MGRGGVAGGLVGFVGVRMDTVGCHNLCELSCAFPFVWIDTDGQFSMPGMHGTTA